jgi:ATP-dependent Clp protease adaptor protein ClpS
MYICGSKTPKPKIHEENGDSLVVERQLQKTKPPAMHQVLMLNDDYTPMEFVVMVIQDIFGKDIAVATQIMLKIHMEGKAVCGIYTPDIAASKVDQVMGAAKHYGHPLQCIHEPIE